MVLGILDQSITKLLACSAALVVESYPLPAAKDKNGRVAIGHQKKSDAVAQGLHMGLVAPDGSSTFGMRFPVGNAHPTKHAYQNPKFCMINFS